MLYFGFIMMSVLFAGVFLSLDAQRQANERRHAELLDALKVKAEPKRHPEIERELDELLVLLRTPQWGLASWNHMVQARHRRLVELLMEGKQ
jgi:hypothetical protein